MFSFLFYIFTTLVAWRMAPGRLDGAKASTFDSISVPTATEDRAPLIPFGTVLVAGNVLWYGDYKADPIEKSVRVNPIKTARQTIGYRICLGMWQSLAGAPIDAITLFKVGDHTVWSGNSTVNNDSPYATVSIPVSASWTTQEGQEAPDGVDGTLRFLVYGEPSAPSSYNYLGDNYLKAQVDANHPVYPNTTQVVWLGPSSVAAGASLPGRPASSAGFVGISNNIQAWTFGVRRLPKTRYWLPFGRTDVTVSFGAMTQAVWLADRGDIGGDANPAFVIAELLTSPLAYLNGPRLPWRAIDANSFLRTADRLKSEGNGVSFALEVSRKLKDVIDDVLRQINGVMEIDERSGRIALRLLREDDVPVATFNASNITSLDPVSRVALDTAPNEITVPYLDRSLNFEERVAVATNNSGFAMAGSVISQERRFIGVTNATLAQTLASREMRMLSTSLARRRFRASLPPSLVLKPGHLITVEDPDDGQVLRMRIQSARYGSYQSRTEVEIEAIEDIFRAGSATGAVIVSPTVLAPTLPPTAAANPQVFPAPYALTGSDYDKLMYIAEAADARTTQLRPAIKEGVSSWSTTVDTLYVPQAVRPIIAGTSDNAMTAVEYPSSAVLTLSSTALAAFMAYGKASSLYVLAGSEWLYAGSTTVNTTTGKLTLSGLERGVFDSVPETHAVGKRFALLVDYGIDEGQPQTLATDTGATLPGFVAGTMRADSLGPGGVVLVDNAAGSQAVFGYNASASRAQRPLPVGLIRMESSIGTNDSTAAGANLSRSSAVTLSWINRSRTLRNRNPYFFATESCEASQFVKFTVYYEGDTSGSWTSLGSAVSTASGATSAAVSLASVPTGSRRIRVDIQSSRPGTGGDISSVLRSYYWRLTT